MRVSQTIRSSLVMSCVVAPAMACAADPIDFSRRLGPSGAVPENLPPYVVPTTNEVKVTIDRVGNHVTQKTSLKVFDHKQGVEITTPDLANPNPNAVLDNRYTPFNRWDYPNGITWSAFHRITDITGYEQYRERTMRVYDFIFAWIPYFGELEKQTGRRNEFSMMINMAALHHCGAISAGLIRTQLKSPDPRFREWIDEVDDYISNGQFRLSDGTLARERPQAVSLWTDDYYMGISFLAQMGRLTGEGEYWDDAIWNGVATRVLRDGRVDGICEGTTYANDYVYYTFRGASADTIFVGPVLYAGVEIIRLLENPNLEISAPKPNAVNSAMHLKAKG